MPASPSTSGQVIKNLHSGKNSGPALALLIPEQRLSIVEGRDSFPPDVNLWWSKADSDSRNGPSLHKKKRSLHSEGKISGPQEAHVVFLSAYLGSRSYLIICHRKHLLSQDQGLRAHPINAFHVLLSLDKQEKSPLFVRAFRAKLLWGQWCAYLPASWGAFKIQKWTNSGPRSLSENLRGWGWDGMGWDICT